MSTTEDDGYIICLDMLQRLQISDTATVHFSQYWNILNTILYVVYYKFQLLQEAVIFNFQPGCQQFMCLVPTFSNSIMLNERDITRFTGLWGKIICKYYIYMYKYVLYIYHHSIIEVQTGNVKCNLKLRISYIIYLLKY